MPISKAAKKKIDDSAKRFTNYLIYRSIGPHALNAVSLKDLITSGWVKEEGTVAAVLSAYAKTHTMVAETSAPKSVREGTISFLENQFKRYAERAGNELKSDIGSIIDSQLMPFKNAMEGKQVSELLKDPQNFGKYLGNALHEKVDNWRHRYSTIVKTELSRASNWGSLDAIIHNNKDKNPEDIYVFKTGPNDSITCKYCKAFWFTSDGKPKVYKLSELVANGTNIGKKVADWKPGIDSVHPNCRHLLVNIRDGYTFDEKNNLSYHSKDHSEYKIQKK